MLVSFGFSMTASLVESSHTCRGSPACFHTGKLAIEEVWRMRFALWIPDTQ